MLYSLKKIENKLVKSGGSCSQDKNCASGTCKNSGDKNIFSPLSLFGLCI